MKLIGKLDVPADHLQRLTQQPSLPNEERAQNGVAIDYLLPSPFPSLYVESASNGPANLHTVYSRISGIETLEQQPGLHRRKRRDILDLWTRISLPLLLLKGR